MLFALFLHQLCLLAPDKLHTDTLRCVPIFLYFFFTLLIDVSIELLITISTKLWTVLNFFSLRYETCSSTRVTYWVGPLKKKRTFLAEKYGVLRGIIVVALLFEIKGQYFSVFSLASA